VLTNDIGKVPARKPLNNFGYFSPVGVRAVLC